MKTTSERWGSRIGLILAMAGNAVGLGNFLRFPVQAVQNGGGAFLIPYFVCFVLLGIPLLWMEWASGRYAGKQGFHSTPAILQALDPKRAVWQYVGVFGLFINLAVAAYYCYLESWAFSYTFYALFGAFSELKPDEVAKVFDLYIGRSTHFVGVPVAVVSWLFCLGLNVWILRKGVQSGIEWVAKIAMPLLLLFGVVLAIKAVSLQGGGESGAVYDGIYGLNFLWKPDFSTIWSPKVWLSAAGQVFFTLSVGTGAVQCYASYVREKEDIALNAMAAGWMNEFVEVVLGGAIILPIAIGYLGIEGVQKVLTQSGSLGLGFRTLPSLFVNWGGILGALGGAMWFGLLFFAGITSSLAMGQPVSAFLQENLQISRENAVLWFGGLILILGLPTVFFFEYGVFDEYDYWAGTLALVVFALIETILFGWVFGIEKGWKELNEGGDIQAPVIFKYISRYVTPLLLVIILVAAFIQPENQEGKIIVHTEVNKKDTLFWKDTIKGKETLKFKSFKPDTLVQRDTLRNLNDWKAAIDSINKGKIWALDKRSVLATLQHQGVKQEIRAWEDTLQQLYKKRNRVEVNARIEKAHRRIQHLRYQRQFTNGARVLLLTLLGGLVFLLMRKKR